MALLSIYEPEQTPAPNQSEEIAIGIDLGTTNSLVAICQNQKPEIILDKNGNFMQPSVVAISNQNLIAGIKAKNIDGEQIHSIKRLMGKGFEDIQNINSFPFQIKQYNQNFKIILGDKELTAVEISAQILKTLKDIAENNLGKTISKAVITVPAYFDEVARNATKQAANLAGLEVLRLISEPTAAAIAYGLDKENISDNIGSIYDAGDLHKVGQLEWAVKNTDQKNGIYAVFDLGGGTFDVSILQLSKGVFKVIGVGGDSALGGDDFDNLIGKTIIEENNLQNLSNFDLQNIKLAAREAKENLTNQEQTEIKLNLKNQIIRFKISKADFKNISQNLTCKTIKITQNLLEELDLEIGEIKAIILVGGSTRMPFIKEKLREFFGEDKILDNIDPDKIVALGAAIQAEALTTRNSNNLLLDVIPLSLGLEMMGGLVEKIITRNSTIPTLAFKEFTTYADGQNGMKFHIVQGEREFANDCRSLANFEIKNIPALKAGVARVRVDFKVDADGLLTVSATEQTTGQKQIVEIKPSFGLDEIQVKNILLESLKNSKTDIAKRLLIEAKVEAQRNILALKASLTEDKDLFDKELSSPWLKKTWQQIAKLEEAIVNENQQQINIEAENLEKFAEQLAKKKMNKAINQSLIGKKIDDV
jgi:molecular chaperone HscA